MIYLKKKKLSLPFSGPDFFFLRNHSFLFLNFPGVISISQFLRSHALTSPTTSPITSPTTPPPTREVIWLLHSGEKFNVDIFSGLKNTILYIYFFKNWISLSKYLIVRSLCLCFVQSRLCPRLPKTWGEVCGRAIGASALKIISPKIKGQKMYA